MTEAEWEVCQESGVSLGYLETVYHAPLVHSSIESWYNCPSSRRVRLFGCACARSQWHLIKNWEAQSAVSVVEKVVDGQLPLDRLKEVGEAVRRYRGRFRDELSSVPLKLDDDPLLYPEQLACRVAALGCDVWEALREILSQRWPDLSIRTRHLAILRDIFGNPFRPSLPLPLVVLRWNDGIVRLIAEGIYEVRRMPEGVFDNSRLAILSDALLEAGCDNEDLIAHCRSPGPHVRGCWALDQILGKT